MKRNETENEVEYKPPRYQILLLILIFAAINIFGAFNFTAGNFYIRFVLNGSYTQLVIREILYGLLFLVGLFVFGIISDNTRSKYGRRRPYFLAGVIGGIAIFVYFLTPSYWVLLLVDVAVIATCICAFQTARDVIIPDLYKKEERGRINGIVAGVVSILGLLPEGIYLMMYEFSSTTNSDGGKELTQGSIFLLLGSGGILIIISSLLIFIFLREKIPVSELPPKKPFREEFVKIFRYKEFREEKDFYWFSFGFMVYSIGARMIGFYQLFYIFELGLPTILLVVDLAFFAPIGALCVYFGGLLSDKYGRKPLILPLLVLGSIGCILLPFAVAGGEINLILVVISIFLILQGTATIDMPLLAWKQDLLPKEERGKYNGIAGVLLYAIYAPTSLITAIILDAFGLDFLFLVIPLFYFASLPFFLKVSETVIKKEKEINQI